MERDLLAIEKELFEKGYKNVCGVDEAGRGPLAGPVFAAAVILPQGLYIEGLDDSKKLSEKKRDKLFDIICEKALAFGIAESSEREIDEINILNASLLAMKRATEKLKISPDYILIDGNKTFPDRVPTESVIKGDGLSASIAAASILAKVSRDRFMLKLAEEFPEYMFEKHKGYPTKLHYECVEKYGLSRVHRKSFFKKYKDGALLK